MFMGWTMKILILTISSLFISLNMVVSHNEVQSDPLAEKAEKVLYQVLKTQSEFVKAHAAEYLIWLGKTEEARIIFLEEDKLYHDLPKYRVVVWRVLAQTEKDTEGKKKWTDQIFKAFVDEQGQDRIHAAETLGKLKLSPTIKYADATNKILKTEKENLYVYTLWASSQASKAAYETNKVKFLNLLYTSKIENLRRVSAFVLRREGNLTATEWTTLTETALAETSTSSLKKTLLNTAIATVPVKMDTSLIYVKAKEELLNDFDDMPAGTRIETALVLADHGTLKDLPVLAYFLADRYSAGQFETNSPVVADIRATAAYAILKIKKRINIY